MFSDYSCMRCKILIFKFIWLYFDQIRLPNLIHMRGACHNPNKTNVMTNFKILTYGYLVAEWLERLTSERVVGGSNPTVGNFLEKFFVALQLHFFKFPTIYRNGRPLFKNGRA